MHMPARYLALRTLSVLTSENVMGLMGGFKCHGCMLFTHLSWKPRQEGSCPATRIGMPQCPWKASHGSLAA